MKKKILMLAIASFALVTPSTFAQCQKDLKKTECTEKVCDKDMKKCDMTKMPDAFAGIELSVEQKAKLADLRTYCKQQEKEGKKVTGQECMAKVKGILTPEQYTKFLENKVSNQKHHKKGMKERKAARMECQDSAVCSGAKVCDKAKDAKVCDKAKDAKVCDKAKDLKGKKFDGKKDPKPERKLEKK